MISRISFHPEPESAQRDKNNPVFSILIPSWNNLPYLKCCVESIRKNSRFTHQIIVHVNEGKDDTLKWVEEQRLSHTYSTANVGVCYGFNAPASLAKSDYLVLSDDDYYYAPDWDYYLLREIKSLDHIYFCLTGTMIEHNATNYHASIMSPHNFGKTAQEFDEQKFLREYASIPFENWNGGNWYPMVLHKNLWNLIGGLSIEFTPGMASDPDMMMKLWHCGVRYYKGVQESRVYHFTSRSTARVKKNDGNNQFLLKWKLSKSTFFDLYLRLGKKFMGDTPEPDRKEFKTKLMRDKWKRLFSTWRK
jgi:glycosyltransferase involved in cell wall biosynthesis